EVTQPLQPLGRTERVYAAVSDVGLLANDLSPAHGALGRHAPALLRLHHADDLGDHVTRAVDDDARADVHALLIDLSLVVHRDVPHRDTAADYRLHMRDPRQDPR